MKKSYLTFFLFLGLTGCWYHRLSAHFFEFDTPNQIAFWFFLLSSAVALRFTPIALFKNNLFSFFISIWPIATILLSYPLTKYFIGISDHGWMWINAIALTSALIGTQLNIKWLILPILNVSIIWMIPFNFDSNQKKYTENLILSLKTRKGTIDLVQWKNDLWTYYNGQLSTATPDQKVYGEATLYPLLQVLSEKAKILIIGGDNGVIAQQLKTSNFHYQSLHMIPYDIDFLHNQLKDLNLDSVTLIEQDIATFIEKTPLHFDAIIIDLFNLMESLEISTLMKPYFSKKLLNILNTNGFLLTQIGDIYNQPKLFKSYYNQISSFNYGVVPYHLHIPTLGQIGWVLVSKNLSSEQLASVLKKSNKPFASRWWNDDVMAMMMSMGKQEYFLEKQRLISRN